VKKPSRQPFFVAAFVILFLGVPFFSPAFSLAQDQPEGKRAIVDRVVPVYPDLARRAQIHGTVRVGVVVAPNGKAKFTQVIGGNPCWQKPRLTLSKNGNGYRLRRKPKNSWNSTFIPSDRRRLPPGHGRHRCVRRSAPEGSHGAAAISLIK
jgi:hypothetical protein